MRRPAAILSLVLMVSGMAVADELRTLFHTPEERARLDRLRRGEPPEASHAERRAPQVTGFVKRSDGRDTVWIDGRPVAMSGAASKALTDSRKAREAARGEPPAIEIKRTR